MWGKNDFFRTPGRFAFGCKGVVQIDPEDIESLVVDPSEIILETRPELAVEQEFAAYAKLADDELVRLDLISWSSSNMSAGSIDDDGIFTSVQTNGGITDIVAKHMGKEGSARVTVVYTDDLIEEEVDQRVVNAFQKWKCSGKLGFGAHLSSRKECHGASKSGGTGVWLGRWRP